MERRTSTSYFRRFIAASLFFFFSALVSGCACGVRFPASSCLGSPVLLDRGGGNMRVSAFNTRQIGEKRVENRWLLCLRSTMMSLSFPRASCSAALAGPLSPHRFSWCSGGDGQVERRVPCGRRPTQPNASTLPSSAAPVERQGEGRREEGIYILRWRPRACAV